MKKKIAIIGGGAAGLMAAATIVETSADVEVHVFDKNDFVGAKVIISGGGRCNVTTGITDRKELFSKYTRGADFLKAALTKMTPQRVFEWFEAHGVPLKIEKDNRVFPVSDDGHDVVGAFDKVLGAGGAIAHLSTKVTNITSQGDQFLVATPHDEFLFDAVIITTGGNAYRHTGSEGDGYFFAQNFGHTITPLGPSLNSFLVSEQWVKELSGVSLPWAMLKSGTAQASGPFLFTHFGISGPLTFSFASQLPYIEITPAKPLIAHLIPDANKKFADWEAILNPSKKENAKVLLKTAIKEFVPTRLIEYILQELAIPLTTQVVLLPKEKRQALSKLLGDGIALTLTHRRPGDEFVTAGGVDTAEVNPQTMESLLKPGLYFAGEVLNIDALTGGFNLQSSWATGYLAGLSSVKRFKKTK